MSRTIAGFVYEVFDLNGELVGYFASEGHGFVDASTKDALVAQGFMLLDAPAPGEQARSAEPPEGPQVVPPSTHPPG